jgi:DNA-binding beta-propeller fold protein YncE
MTTPTVRASLIVSSAHNDSILNYDQNAGTFINTFVPSGNGGLALPEGLAFGPDGNLYVDSFANNSVLRYNGSSGAFMGTFVSPGSGGLVGPHGLVFGPDRNLYVIYNPGTEPPDSGTPSGVKRYDGSSGAFMGDFVPAGQLSRADHGVFGPDGNFYVISGDDNAVFRYNGSSGAFIGTFVPPGSGGLDGPIDLVFGPDGNLYVTSYLNNSVLRYNGSTGAFMGAFVTCGSGGIDGPFGLMFGPDGNLYVISHEEIGELTCAAARRTSASSVLRYNGSTGAFMDVFVSPGSGGLDGATALIFTPVPEPNSRMTLAVGTLGLIIYRWLTAWPGRRRQQSRRWP